MDASVSGPSHSSMTESGTKRKYEGMKCTICKNWGHTGKVCPNSEVVKKRKSEGRMHCYFCGKQGHTHPDCPELRVWKMKTGGQQEIEHLLKLDIQNATIPIWVPAQKDFTDFISCIEKAFTHCSPSAGGVLLCPKWQIDPPDFGGDWSKSPVTVRKQKFIKRRPGVYTADYSKPTSSRVELFLTKAILAELDKAGSFNISSSESFWKSALEMFDNIATSKKYPIYVIDKEGTFFPRNSQNYWHLAALRNTFTPFLRDSNTVLPGINETVIMIAQIMSYTAWHVEDMNFPSVIYHHFGAPKFWIIVPQAFATRLINLFKAEIPDYYEKCEAAETHKNILAFPQILKAANPPIPFKCIKQCVGQYVVTFPGAYHMVLNSGYNVCEGLNFSVDRWTRKYAKKERKCTCDLKPKPEDDVSLSFKIE